MKKLIIIFLIAISLLFNVVISMPVFAATNFKEGVYKLSDFGAPIGEKYTVENVSESSNVYIAVFDENQRLIQYYNLEPKSEKQNLIQLQPKYRILVLGNGEAVIQ